MIKQDITFTRTCDRCGLQERVGSGKVDHWARIEQTDINPLATHSSEVWNNRILFSNANDIMATTVDLCPPCGLALKEWWVSEHSKLDR